MKKNEMVLSALLCAMLLANTGIAMAEPSPQDDAMTFDKLKRQIENGQDPVNIEDLQDAIQFKSALEVKNKKVTISGKKGEDTASFSPATPEEEIPPADPPKKPYNAPAFNIAGEKKEDGIAAGELTLKYLNVTGFGDTEASSIISNNGKLTIGPGVTFADNKVKSSSSGGRPYPFPSAIITNQGEMTIETEEGGDVTFEPVTGGGNPNPDISFSPSSSLTIKGAAGTVTFGNGLISHGDAGTITHEGTNTVVFSGNNANYTGTYTQTEDGITTFDKDGQSFLGGTSDFKKGTLKWEAQKEDATHGSLKFGENTNLIVGTSDADGESKSGRLTLNGANDTISTTINMTVNNGSTLTLKNYDGKNKEAMVLKNKINGEGTLILDNDKITLDGTEGGLASGLTLNTKNTYLTLSKFANDSSTLNVIVQALDEENNGHNNLDLTLTDYNGTIESDLEVDGTHIAKVTFTGTNNIGSTGGSGAGLNISGTGSAVNNAQTIIGGNVTIEKATDDNTIGLTNQGSGSFTVEGTFKNAGKISNNGASINLDEGGTNTGTIEGSGDIVAGGGTFTNDYDSETQATGNINITGEMNVVESLVNKGNITITGKGGLNVGDVETGKKGDLHNESGTIDLSQANGDFTVSGTVQNSSGTIKGKSATFGTYNDSTGSGTSLELTGDLTINGGKTEEGIPLANALQNSGSVKAGSITVKKGGITNSGENAKIEVKSGETYGDITLDDGGIANGDEHDTKGGMITANDIKASGDVTNKGTIDAKGDITVKDITNTGTGSTEGGKNATITSEGKITASGTVSNVGSSDKITAQSMELGSIEQNNGTIESTNGGITVDGTEGNVNNTSGTITSAGALNVKGKLTNGGNVSMVGGELKDVSMSAGSITNTGDLTITGTVDGSNGTITHSNGKLEMSGSGSGFTGTYSQTGGTAEVTSANGLFGGAKNISGGTLSASGANTEMYNGKVTLSNGGAFNFNYTGENGSITKDILEYSTGGGSATFSGSGTYTLNSDIDGSQGSIKFSGTKLELKTSEGKKEFNYKNFGFENSELILAKKNDNQLDEFTFNNFNVTGDSSVDLDLKLMNGGSSSRYLDSDRLTFGGNSSGNLNVGKVYISGNGQEDGYDFDTQEGKDVITNQEGSNVHFNTGSKGESAFVGSNSYTYDLKVKENTLGLTVTGVADENTLYEANRKEGERKFFIDTNKGEGEDKGKYNIGKSLDESSAKTGKGYFDVYGSTDGAASGTRDAILSGLIKGEEGAEAKHGSLFEIESKTGDDEWTKLTLTDLTIQDAQSSTRGGSVVSNSDADSKVTMTNVTVKDNSSSASDGKGGAIYNNGGTGDDPNSNNAPGLVLEGVTFENNTATAENGKGGAIYNDQQGHMILTDVITEAVEGGGEGKNDIYNDGFAITEGTNTFNSLYTNATNGTSTFKDNNAFSSLVNESSTAGKGVTFETGSKNTVSEKFDNKGTATNKGSLEFTGTSDKNSEFANSGTFTNEADSNLIVGENATVTGNGDGAKLSNSGNVYLQGDASGYKGTFTQDADGAETTVVGENAKFFGGASNTVSNGTLNWGTKNDLAKGAKLIVSGSGTEFNIGDGDKNAGSITFRSGSSIADGVKTNIYGNGKLAVDGGNVTLGNGKWLGEVDLTNGNLTLKDSNNFNETTEGVITGILKATNGNLKLEDETQLVLGEGSSVAKDVVTNIGEKSKVVLQQGDFTIDDQDTWSGLIVLDNDSTGTLTFDKYTNSLGKLQALAGSVKITEGSKITFSSDDEKNPSGIGKTVQTTIDGTSEVTLGKNGYLELDDDEGTADTWEGKVTLSGGTFDYGIKNPDDDKIGELDAQSGNLNLLSGSVLKIKEPSEVDDAVSVDIRQGSTVDIQDKAKFNIDSKTGDKWHGLVKNEGGEFTTKGLSNRDGGGQLQQKTGSSTFDEKSDILISGDSHISGGDVSVLGASSLTFASGDNLKFDNFAMKDSSSFSILNGVGQTVDAGKFDIKDNNDFALDVDLRGGSSDKFNFKEFTEGSEGNINVSDFGFVGGAPVYRNVELQLFDADNIPDDVTFSATDKQVMTPIGEYGLKSLGGGRYLASLGRYNPKVFRGQAATLAMYNNQLAINDLLLNHIILHSEKNEFGQGRTANRYAAVNPLFAPYQYTRKEGGLWYKSYVDIERLSMTHNLNVNNTAYGSIIGADLPLISLENGWDFIPTFYVAYNGSNQSYNGVDMYQNGGQGGFMGTFMKNDFIGSVLAYGGGYFNEMNVEGFTDKTGNWFAGTAAKAAYNLHATQHFTIQPTALVSYNAFGKQSWGTDFGVMGMNSGMLNGINVAPGLNLIYARDTWSLYATFQYMFNINDHVGGHAGVDVDLPNLSMRHGYFQYGIGATKTFKDRFNSYFQFVVRNGGRTGVGFQLGLQYLFDWTNVGHKKQTAAPAKKSVIKNTDKNTVPVNVKNNKSKQNNDTKPAVIKNSKPVKVNSKVEINNESKNVVTTQDGVKKTVIKQLKK